VNDYEFQIGVAADIAAEVGIAVADVAPTSASRKTSCRWCGYRWPSPPPHRFFGLFMFGRRF
jgi:hypothetical protein